MTRDASDLFAGASTHLIQGVARGQKLIGNGALETRARGATVELSDGTSVIDFASYGVNLIGHSHPHVVAAVQRQLQDMAASTRVLLNEAPVSLAERLVGRLGAGLSRVWFGSDGADGVEAAMKLARLATGRPRILAVKGGFHGKTMGALAATWDRRYRSGLEELLPGVTHIDLDPLAVASETAKGDVAALLFEPIQGEGGVRPLPASLVARWASDAKAAGAFVVADEVQVGLGRSGHHSCAVDAGIAVDAVILGKALAGGIGALSALVCSDALFAPLASEPLKHTSTFSAHPLLCAAALATLEVIDLEWDNALSLGKQLGNFLYDLDRRTPSIIDVRGEGLLWGIDFVSPAAAGAFMLKLAREGLLTSPCLTAPTTIRLLPPMVTSGAELDVAQRALQQAAYESDRFIDRPIEPRLGASHANR